MNIADEVKLAKTIGIAGHVRPDGDCVGAVMGLYMYLKKLLPKARIDIYLEQPADIFACIRDIDKICSDFSTDIKYDTFFALDCNLERLGDAGPIFKNAVKKINIDHHISNSGCGDLNFIEPKRSSTCELIYEMMDETQLDIDIAKAIYIGIVHDTGVFQYSNTSPRTLEIASKLIKFGFDFSKLINETFYEKTYLQSQIMGRAILESMRLMDGKCIVSRVSRKNMEFYTVGPKDLDGIVNQLMIVKGVECAIFMYETKPMEYKVSLRSGGKINVSEIALKFGGGGHVRAAGCTMHGTYHDVINNLSVYIEEQLKESTKQPNTND